MILTTYQQALYLLAVDHKIDHKYPKLLMISLLNKECNAFHILRKTIIGKLQPIVVTDSEVNNISWTTDGTTTMNKPTELPGMLPETGFRTRAQY